MCGMPSTVSTMNQVSVTGPNMRPTAAVPKRCAANSPVSTASVTGTTKRCRPGAATSRPSTAWTLTVVVSLKYVVLILRADNNGEGGLIAMLALASQAVKDRPVLRRRPGPVQALPPSLPVPTLRPS